MANGRLLADVSAAGNGLNALLLTLLLLLALGLLLLLLLTLTAASKSATEKGVKQVTGEVG